MKFGFILTTYDRIDDLLAHIDILKFVDFDHEVIPIWMKKDVPDYFVDEMKNLKHSHYCDGIDFARGPLLGLCSGLRKANELGLDYIVYRNGDDWLFNHEFVRNNLSIMGSGKYVAAYNWLSCNTKFDYALNEMYIDVKKFMKTIDESEHYFKSTKSKSLCEVKMAKWINMTLDSSYSHFYRLPDREVEPGVGYEIETLPTLFKMMGQKVPDGLVESLVDNHRFFNKKWQLIGSHCNIQRITYYNRIRKEIPYHRELEKQTHFNRWLDSIYSKWNLPSERTTKTISFKTAPKIRVPKMMPRKRSIAAAQTIHQHDEPIDQK